MIFVTVGTQLPFDRLVLAMDRWAAVHPGCPVIAQTGASAASAPHLDVRARVTPAEFCDLVAAADAVVAHAGMGSILTAIELGKPVVVMPRRADRGEHRNDHQLATTAGLSHIASIRVAHDEHGLASAIDEALSAGVSAGVEQCRESSGLIREIAAFVLHATPHPWLPWYEELRDAA